MPVDTAPEAPDAAPTESPIDRAMAILERADQAAEDEHKSRAAALSGETAPEAPAANGAADAPPPAEASEKTDDKRERESRRWAELERREQHLRREHQKRVAELEAEKKQIEAQKAQWQAQLEAIERLKEDPFTALQKLGHRWEDLVARQLKGEGAKIDLSPVQTEIEALKQQIEEMKVERHRHEHERQLNEYKTQIQRDLANDPDDAPGRWALLRQEPNWHDEVYQLMAIQYQRSNGAVVLTHQEAADKLESYLRDQTKRRISDPSVRRLLGLESGTAAETDAGAKQQQPAQRATRATQVDQGTDSRATEPETLSNQHTAEVASRSKDTADAEECRRRAVTLLDKLGGLGR